MKIADLFAEVGFKFDTIKLHEVTKLIGDLNVSSIVGATSVASLGMEIKKMIDSTAEVSSNLKTINANTGINNQFTQQFENAAEALGSSKENADGFLTSLSALQEKIRLGQGGAQAFQLMGFLRLDPVSFNKIVGRTEDLTKAIFKALSKPLRSGTPEQIQNQIRDRAYIANLLSLSPDMNKAAQNPAFFQEMLKFKTLSNEEIQNSAKNTQAWVEATKNVNMEFTKLAITILPNLTAAVNAFMNNGGFKTLVDTLSTLGRAGNAFSIGFGALTNFTKAGLMNVASAASQPLINAQKLGHEIQRLASINVSTGPITVHANNPEEFTKRFDAVWKKELSKADIQFGQQT